MFFSKEVFMMKEIKFMHNKRLKILFIVLMIVAILSIAVFLFQRNIKEDDVKEEAIKKPPIEISRAHFFRAGTGNELGERDEEKEITQFNPGDYMGINGQYKINEETKIETSLLNENKEVITKRILPSFTAYENKEVSGFIMCCGGVPKRAGKYYIEIVIDEETVEALPFEVVK